MKTMLICLALAAAGITAGARRQVEIKALAAENQRGRALEAEINRLKKENLRLGGIETDMEKLAQLRAERGELVRLRGEASQARQAAELDPEAARQELRTLQAQTESARKEGELVIAWRASKEYSKWGNMTAQRLMNAIQVAGQNNGGQMPLSFDELEKGLRAPSVSEDMRRYWLSFLTETNLHGSAKGRFEFTSKDRTLPDPEQFGLKRIFLREREPRRLPDGRWARIYAYADGQAEDAIVEDGDFEAWESALKP